MLDAPTLQAPVLATSATLGIVGLGAMGGAMASRLIASGHRVAGYDIDPAAIERLVSQKGHRAYSPADAARDAGVLVIMVHNEQQVERVLFADDGAAATLRPGAVVWLASTVTPGFVRSLAPRLSATEVLLVDGPVSGGVTGAENGELTVIAGGTAEALGLCARAIEACAHHVYRVGDVGSGSAVKMINQVLVATHIALTAEALALAVRAGVDPVCLIEVITHSAGTSKMFEKRAPRIATGDHSPHSTVNTFLKDLGIALDTARELGVPTPISASAHQVFTMAAGAGHGSASDTMVARVYEEWAGIRIAEAVR